MAPRKVRRRISSGSSDQQSIPESTPLPNSVTTRATCPSTLSSNTQRRRVKGMMEVSLFGFSLPHGENACGHDQACNCADVNNFYFVIPAGKSKLTVSTQMKEAYEGCLGKGFSEVFWLEESEALDYRKTWKSILDDRRSFFVLEDFNSSTFIEFEKKMNQDFLIIGPLVLLHMFLTNELSFFHCGYPIFNLAFFRVNVSMTGIKNPERDELIALIRRMGGFYHPKYVNNLTHMITNSVFTDKAVEASRRKLPLMKMEWVKAVWERSYTKLTHATVTEFSCYKAPIFYNVKASFSQFSNHAKAKLQRYIEGNGGSVTDSMEGETTNLLVAKNGEGEKYKQAEMSKIPVVRPEWISESIKKGYVVSIKDHTVLSLEQNYPMNSTPVDLKVHLPDLSACSAIPNSSNNLPLDSSMFLTQFDITTINTGKGSNYLGECSNSIGKHQSIKIPQEEPKAGPSRASATVGLQSEYLDVPEHTRITSLRNEIDDDERFSTQLFCGKKFLVPGIDEDINKRYEAVESVGGDVVKNDPDFCILPPVYIPVSQDKKNCPLFTVHWLFDCDEQNSTEIELKYYHTPQIAMNEAKGILEDVVLSISSYSASERTYIEALASYMGAKVQDALAKKQKNQYLPTTHLITNSLGNDKAKAAGRWKISIVTYKWILDCYKNLRKMDTAPYEPKAEDEDDTENEIIQPPSLPKRSSGSSIPISIGRMSKQSTTVMSTLPSTQLSPSSTPVHPHIAAIGGIPTSNDSNSDSRNMQTPEEKVESPAIPDMSMNLDDSFENEITPDMIKKICFPRLPSPETPKIHKEWLDYLNEKYGRSPAPTT